MNNPALIVALANARLDWRPPGARHRGSHDALVGASAASDLLTPFLGRPVKPRELAALRELHGAVVAIVVALIDHNPPPLGKLNRIATVDPLPRTLELRADGALTAAPRPGSAGAAAILAERVISEFDDLDPRRLRRCARPECDLIFYDHSRSGTQRWHSERPCGLRERQRRHRAVAEALG